MAFKSPFLTFVVIVGFSVLSGNAASICFLPDSCEDSRRRWSFEAGVAFITSNNIEQFLSGEVDIDDGPAGGEIYSLAASRRLGLFELELWGHTFHPRLEMPLSIEIVDENSRSPFFDVSASLIVRWVEFPWNHIVETSIATGLGISYSQNIYLMDIQRHPGSDRSHVKFNWPIQMTFAHPCYSDHQLMLFIAHKSGGEVFDRGGVNSLGFGYRFSY